MNTFLIVSSSVLLLRSSQLQEDFFQAERHRAQFVQIPSGIDHGARHIAADRAALQAFDFERASGPSRMSRCSNPADARNLLEPLLNGSRARVAPLRGSTSTAMLSEPRRRFVRLSTRVRGDDLALADDDHLLADLLDLRQDVRAENDGVVAGQALDQRAGFVICLGSRPDVGSSRISTSGLWMIACASPTRCR